MLRAARENDLPRIVEIYNSTVLTRVSTADLAPVSVDDRLDWFHNHSPERPILVDEADEGIQAWISFEDFYGRAAYRRTAELSLYVAPQARGKGIGSRVLAEALIRARAIGLRSVVGYVFSHNPASIRLLEGAGFDRWGELPGIAEMDGREYSLLIMGKRLT